MTLASKAKNTGSKHIAPDAAMDERDHIRTKMAALHWIGDCVDLTVERSCRSLVIAAGEALAEADFMRFLREALVGSAVQPAGRRGSRSRSRCSRTIAEPSQPSQPSHPPLPDLPLPDLPILIGPTSPTLASESEGRHRSSSTTRFARSRSRTSSRSSRIDAEPANPHRRRSILPLPRPRDSPPQQAEARPFPHSPSPTRQSTSATSRTVLLRPSLRPWPGTVIHGLIHGPPAAWCKKGISSVLRAQAALCAHWRSPPLPSHSSRFACPFPPLAPLRTA